MVEVLLSAQIDGIDIRDYKGLTALSWATKRGNVAVANLLLEKRADSRIVDLYGATCLSLASREGHAEIVRVLLDHGADWSVLDNSGLDALCMAVLEGHDSVEALLLSAGATLPDDIFGFGVLYQNDS